VGSVVEVGRKTCMRQACHFLELFVVCGAAERKVAEAVPDKRAGEGPMEQHANLQRREELLYYS
jgi:hypothetical protein